jgi:hypothetical protein
LRRRLDQEQRSAPPRLFALLVRTRSIRAQRRTASTVGVRRFSN